MRGDRAPAAPRRRLSRLAGRGRRATIRSPWRRIRVSGQRVGATVGKQATCRHWSRPSSSLRGRVATRSSGRASCGRSMPASGASLTLVAAPAGYGKTTAVRAWCESREGAFAWVTLDEGDNDPVRFWTYVATAVDRVRQGLGRGALQRLSVAGSSIERAVDELMNAIAAYGSGLALVLDDLQTVTDRGVSCLDRLRAQASAGERAPDRHHTGGSRARAGAAACPRRARGIARRRVGVHRRGGARAARRARAGRARSGGDRAARREHRGLAGCARPRRALASGRRRPGPGRVRVRGRPALRGRVPEPGGSRFARRRESLVPARGRRFSADSPPSSATPCSSAPIRRPCWPGSSAPTCSSAGWSEEAGSVSTHCSPSSPLLNSQR